MPERQPERGRVHLVFGQFKFSGADVFVREELDLLEANHLRSHEHVTVDARPAGPANGLFFSDFEHANLGVADRVRVVVHIDRFHVSLALVEIQMLNVILLPLVDVDRLRMNGRERAKRNRLRRSPRVCLGLRRLCR